MEHESEEAVATGSGGMMGCTIAAEEASATGSGGMGCTMTGSGGSGEVGAEVSGCHGMGATAGSGLDSGRGVIGDRSLWSLSESGGSGVRDVLDSKRITDKMLSAGEGLEIRHEIAVLLRQRHEKEAVAVQEHMLSCTHMKHGPHRKEMCTKTVFWGGSRSEKDPVTSSLRSFVLGRGLSPRIYPGLSLNEQALALWRSTREYFDEAPPEVQRQCLAGILKLTSPEWLSFVARIRDRQMGQSIAVAEVLNGPAKHLAIPGALSHAHRALGLRFLEKYPQQSFEDAIVCALMGAPDFLLRNLVLPAVAPAKTLTGVKRKMP